MSAILQRATAFFFDHFGHRIIQEDSSLPAGIEPKDDVTCDLCDRHGPGVWDGRGNHGAYRCLPCWSFYRRSDIYFPGTDKDRSFAGKIKTGWVVDDNGISIYVSQKTFDGKPPEERIMSGLRFLPVTTPIMDILNGHIKPPFLWGLFGVNKDNAIRVFEVTESLSRIVFCDGKACTRVYYDLDHIREGIASVAALSEAHRKDSGFYQWMYGADIVGTKKRLDIKKDLRRLGLESRMLQLSLSERDIVRRAVNQA